MRELSRWGVTMVVAASVVAHGCGSGGGSGDGASTSRLEGDAAVQASVGVLQSTVTALVSLRTEGSPTSSLSSTCTSGDVKATCAVENRLSIIEAAFNECRILLDGGTVATVDGDLTVSTSDQGTCITGTIADSATLELNYDDVRQALTDGSGTELFRSRATGTDRIVPNGPGCAGRNVMEHLDATFDAVINVRLPGRLIVDGSDLRVDAQGLQLDQSSSGTPCERSVAAAGPMDVEDRANGVRFSQTLSGMTMSFIEADDAALVRIDGA